MKAIIIQISACLLINSLFSCGKTAKTDTKIGETEQLILNDVAYGTDPLQKMDIALVTSRTEKTPLVILVHGGGWTGGDKKDAGFMKDACFANGINVANINYHIGAGIHYEEMMEDLGNAVSCLLSHADEWKLRKSKIIFWGGSAGGHLSMLYAYNYDTKNIVSLVITLGAPTKLDDPEDLAGASQNDIEELLPIITGKPWNNNPDSLDIAYKKASPYYGKNLKPTLIIHGELDSTVGKLQAEIMGQKLTEAKVDNMVFLLPNGGHNGENTTPEATTQVNKLMYQAIMKYSK